MSIIDKCDKIGERILEEKGINTLPVDVKKLAEDSDFIVAPFPKGQSGNGYAGMLLRQGNDFAIFYSETIKNDGFQRFTIAHELGHYFIDGHLGAVLDASGVHKSREPFSSGDQFEKQADSFAAGLLMPTGLCRRITRQYDDSLEAILALATACNTSLMSSAIRYAEMSEGKIAIIVSENGQVLFSCVSRPMAFSGFFVRSKASLPQTSLSARCGVDSDFIASARSGEQEGDLSDWGSHKSCLCLEQVKGLGATGKILTVLIPQTEEGEDEDEDTEVGGFDLRFR